MKLRTRLIVAFCLITFLPPILFTLVGGAILYPQWISVDKRYNMSGDMSGLTSASFRMVAQMADSIETHVLELINENADRFAENEFLEKLNEECEDKNSYIVMRVESEYIFIGNTDIPITDINAAVLNDKQEVYKFAHDKGQIYRYVDVNFTNGNSGKIYIFTMVDNMVPELKHVALVVFGLVMFILLFTAGVLVTWLYRSVIRPVRALRCAAQNIRDGNLDFDLEIRDDEMGSLAADLDELRNRLKESAEEKVRQNELSRQLISNISHDLKTPITTIKGYAEGLLDGVAKTPEKQEKYLRTIALKADEMTGLIEELAVYSKIDANSIPYDFQELSVKNFFEDCAYDFQTELSAAGIEFSYSNYASENATIMADEEQLRRVMNNLINNSVKYMDKKHRWIALRVSETEKSILVETEDNGCGISQDDLTRVFERFYRADASRHASQNGSGIGLAIVKKIVEEHHGRVWATSKEHIGTVMHLEFNKV